MAGHTYTGITVTVLRVLPRSVIVTTGQGEHVIGRSCLHAASDISVEKLERGDLPAEMTLRVMDWLVRKDGLSNGTRAEVVDRFRPRPLDLGDFDDGGYLKREY